MKRPATLKDAGDLEIAKNLGAAKREEKHDGGVDSGSLKRCAELSGTALSLVTARKSAHFGSGQSP